MTQTLANDRLAVDRPWLDAMMEEVSAFGATGEPGALNRMAATTEHGKARDWLCSLMERRGYEVRVDPVGNVFGVLETAGPDAPLVLVGSHLDSQPNGGRFDGAYGVVAALAAIEAVRAHLDARGEAPGCNFAVVDWTNEEGARFQPSLLGSGVYAGELELDFALAREDGDGLSVGAELARIGYAGTDAAPRADCYIEFHVEGDTALEQSGRHIGPFERYWGALKVRAAMLGERAHTGPTVMAERKDAGLGAAYVMAGLRAMSDKRDGALYTSVGRLVVEPNSPNMVPERATMFIELRAPEQPMLEEAEAELMVLLEESAARASVGHEVISVDRRQAGRFDPRLVALCEAEAAAQGLETMRLETIGGHDAVPLSRYCPGIVIAVPSVGGILHHPDEYTTPEDCERGANVLAAMLWRLHEAEGDLDAATARSEGRGAT